MIHTLEPITSLPVKSSLCPFSTPEKCHSDLFFCKSKDECQEHTLLLIEKECKNERILLTYLLICIFLVPTSIVWPLKTKTDHDRTAYYLLVWISANEVLIMQSLLMANNIIMTNGKVNMTRKPWSVVSIL